VRAGDAAEEKWTAGSWFHERLWSEPGSWDTGGMHTLKIYARVRRAVLVEGHVSAFAYFGGVPRQILYDNTKLAVAKILGGGKRKKTRAFCELQSHCLFKEKFGRPGKGNDKGKVEGLVGYARRNFLVPIPRVGSWEELNTHLREQAESNESGGCAGRKKRLGNASSATAPSCCRCPCRHMRPARSARRG